MPEYINNVQTQNGYVDACTFPPDIYTTQIVFDIGNNPVLMQVWRPDSALDGKYILDENEALYTAGLGYILTDVAGFRIRSANAGQPAQLIAKRFLDADQKLTPGLAFTGTIQPQGQLQPDIPPASPIVQVKHNGGAAVGPEQNLNLIDGNGITWTVADDPLNSDVDVSAKAAIGVERNGGAPVGPEPNLNFVDANGITWSVVDAPGNSRVSIQAVPGFGTLAMLADSGVLVAPQGAMGFAALPATFMALLVLWYGRTNGAVTEGQIGLTFNSDNGANYTDESDHVQNGALGNLETGSVNSISIGIMPGSNVGTTQIPGSGAIWIPGYASTAFYKEAIGDAYMSASGLGTGQFRGVHGGRWSNTAAINTLSLTPRTGSWVAGSRCVVYGL